MQDESFAPFAAISISLYDCPSVFIHSPADRLGLFEATMNKSMGTLRFKSCMNI